MPLAVCAFILEERLRQGWEGTMGPARCLACQVPVGRGDAVILRGGAGLSAEGDRQDLPAGSKAKILDVSSWEGEESIFLVRLLAGDEVYVARAQFAPEHAWPGQTSG